MLIYLYVKECPHCGLRYFGKTTKLDPIGYQGSGKYWVRHLKMYGQTPNTLAVWPFLHNPDGCMEFALQFSKTNNIHLSDKWANLKEENGLDGVPRGSSPSPLALERGKLVRMGLIAKQEPAPVKRGLKKGNYGSFWRGKKLPPEMVQKMTQTRRKNGGWWHTEETRKLLSEKAKAQWAAMSEEEKQRQKDRLRNGLLGRPCSLETRAKISEGLARRRLQKTQNGI